MSALSVAGLVVPSISIARMPRYFMRPNTYYHDLVDVNLQPSFGRALVNKVKADAQDGRDFVTKAAKVAEWYEPPRGQHVDTWA